MKMTSVRYSEIQTQVHNKQLLINFDHDDDESYCGTRSRDLKSIQRGDNKIPIKKRPSSGVINRIFKDLQNSSSRSLANLRISTTTNIRKTQKFSTDRHEFISRPKTATNRFFTNSEQKKNIKTDIFQELSKQIKKYFPTIITEEQKKQTLEDLKLILNILQKQPDPSTIFQQLQKLQDHLSKYLKHRISHLYFYLIYCKFYSCFYQQPSEKEIKLLSLVQYHARTFYFRKVALLVCLEMQQKYLKINDFQESRNYAIKSLKLAVLIDDRYEEVKMLEYLGVIKFYEGVLNSRGNNLLTERQRLNILKHYKQEDEIPKIFNFLQKNTTTKSTTRYSQQQYYNQNQMNTEDLICRYKNEKVCFNQGQNFLQNDILGENLKKFSRNFHGIVKKIGKKTHVKETIKKINEIGQVKKFIGKDNFITLCPQGNTIWNKNQVQVLVTHKKYALIEKNKQFFKKQLPSIISNLELLILSVSHRPQFIQSKNEFQI